LLRGARSLESNGVSGLSAEMLSFVSKRASLHESGESDE
jgi:hypothetical protein